MNDGSARPLDPAANRLWAPEGTTELVLFDMDDTLLDHWGTSQRALEALRDGFPVFRRRPIEELNAEYQRLLEEVHTRLASAPEDALANEEARTERFMQLSAWCGERLAPDEALGVSRRYRAAYQAARRPVAGAVELLRELHGRVRVGVVSNNHVREQREKIAFLGLEELVGFLVTSEEARVAKPDPSIFRIALGRAGVEADRAVMVGDTWSTDVVGARSAGIRAVWLNRLGERAPEGAEVEELRSLLPALEVARRLLAPETARENRPPNGS